MAFEPAFAPSTVWPPPGALSLEPDDPRFGAPINIPLTYARLEREAQIIIDQKDELADVAREPLGPTASAAKARQKFWRAAIASSIALHVAVVAFFLTTGDEGVLVAGSEDAGIAFLGNAPEDQLSSGRPMDEAVAEVTIIDMVEAKTVEATEAEVVPAETVTEPVDTITAEPVERVQPVQETAEPQMEVAEAAPVPEVERAERVTEAPAAVAPAEMVSEVLATDTVEPVEDDNTVQPVVDPNTVAPTEATPAEQAVTEVAQPVEPVEPETVAEATPDTAPIPEKRPEPVKQAEASKPEIEKKPEPKKVAEKPKPKVKPEKEEKRTTKTAGSGGQNTSDARKGDAGGRSDGTKAKNVTGKGTEKVAGNASASNYKGKVRSKVVRASKRSRVRKTGEATVAFTVTANGGLSGVRLSRSSGSPEIDKAALSAVQRAAPFPPTPDGKGWAFSQAIAFQ
ncbi:MAG TPA: TonB family protein [Rhizobiaceae bacterium]|nr:TonB family protein [Rhizobiaceae bacterium]